MERILLCALLLSEKFAIKQVNNYFFWKAIFFLYIHYSFDIVSGAYSCQFDDSVLRSGAKRDSICGKKSNGINKRVWNDKYGKYVRRPLNA